MTKTLAAGRHLLSDRGLGLSKKVIEIEVKASQEEMTEDSEARARQLMERIVHSQCSKCES